MRDGDPVAQRALVDLQVPGHLGDRHAGLEHQPDRALLEVLVELPVLPHHRPSSKGAMFHARRGSPPPMVDRGRVGGERYLSCHRKCMMVRMRMTEPAKAPAPARIAFGADTPPNHDNTPPLIPMTAEVRSVNAAHSARKSLAMVPILVMAFRQSTFATAGPRQSMALRFALHISAAQYARPRHRDRHGQIVVGTPDHVGRTSLTR